MSNDDNAYHESEFTRLDGWGKGMKETGKANESRSESQGGIAKLTEYLFVTEEMNWKKGLKVLGERGETAIVKELQQIHDMEDFQLKHWHKLTKEERAKALKYLMYLKEKRDGTAKGRGCADGRPQRLYMPKVETSSPIASFTG